MARAPKADQVNSASEAPAITPIVPDVPRIGGSFFVDADGKVTRTEWTRLPGEEPPAATETEAQ